MILKIRQHPVSNGADSGWFWMDQIESVNSYGFFMEGGDSKGSSPTFATVRSWEDLERHVASTWGEKRDFDREIWPHHFKSSEFVDDSWIGSYVSTYVAHKRDGGNVLVILADEAFLLSDDGKTVDRLR